MSSFKSSFIHLLSILIVSVYHLLSDIIFPKTWKIPQVSWWRSWSRRPMRGFCSICRVFPPRAVKAFFRRKAVFLRSTGRKKKIRTTLVSAIQEAGEWYDRLGSCKGAGGEFVFFSPIVFALSYSFFIILLTLDGFPGEWRVAIRRQAVRRRTLSLS